ncbi:hypothetical protein CASFOL_011053 [Castilleja foliolosa]|uniref:Uncharacterized protein n=1 Tax=Castilleja foliolosa TaxID=1961234 RepID=A0ABD3DUT7_9LAMI
MRGKKTSPSNPNNGDQETESLEKTHRSEAYNIRCLVKKLSTSKTQNPSPGENISRAQESPNRDSEENRKPARRRGQARKPYQEKLLNMAEARREIVMALKLHRASKKQARDKNQSGPEHEQFGPTSHRFSAEQEARLRKSRRNPRTYGSSYYVNNIDAYAPGLYSSPYYSRPVSLFPPPLFIQDPNFVLPSQTLGLNLNLQDFDNLDTSFIYDSSANSSSIYNSSSSSPSSSYSPALSAAAEEITYMAGAPAVEIISGGDEYQHNTGGVDELNFGISAGRAELLGEMGIGPGKTEDFAVSSQFDGVMEFPAWVNGDESCVSDVCGGAGDYFQDSALPCMDIEEIEGMDGDWLA